MKYRPEIDGLRAVAVVPVVLFHAGVGAFGGGFVGVDVFFVISGYLITTLLMHELDGAGLSFVSFYERRCRRILPALVAVTIACLPFAWMWLPPGDMRDFSQSVLAVSVFASNILFWRESGYFDTAAELKPLLHTWSLAVEEQYYVLFPLLLALLWPMGRQWVLRALAAIAIGSFATSQLRVGSDPMAAFFLLSSRGWELLLGAFVAFRLARVPRHQHPRLIGEILPAAGLMLIILPVLTYTENTPFPGVFALVPTAGTALIILFGSPVTHVGRLLASRLLVGIGLISYSVYLWHQPVLAFARIRLEGAPTGSQLALILATVVTLAIVSWRYIETPFRRRETTSRRKVLTVATVGSIVLASFGLAGHATGGFFEERVSDSQARALATAAPSPKRRECHTEELRYRSPSRACQYHSGTATWAVLGDSHAVELAYALAEELRADRQAVRHYSLSSCAPSFGRPGPDASHCTQWTREAVQLILADPAVRNVLVSYRLNSYLFGDHETVFPALPQEGSDAERAQIWRSYVGLLEELVSAGKTVVLVLQAPEIRGSVVQLIFSRRFAAENIAGVDREWWDRRTAFQHARMNEIPPQVVVVDPSELFCDQESCAAVRDGVALYFDDNHMSVSGARIVVAEVLRRQMTIKDSRLVRPGPQGTVESSRATIPAASRPARVGMVRASLTKQRTIA